MKETVQNAESPNKKRKRDSETKLEDSMNPESQPSKKRRRASSSKPEQTQESPAPIKTKFANPIGSVIGRKRKERRKDKR